MNLKELIDKEKNLTKAVVCFLIKEDKVLLGLRKKVSNGLGINLIAGIGGKVGDSPEVANETDEDALVRELKEEIGVTVTKYNSMGRVRFYWPSKPKWQQDVKVYVGTHWSGTEHETEVIKPIWFNKDSLPVDQMWEDNKFWVSKILSGEEVDLCIMYDENDKVCEVLDKRQL